MNVLLRRFVELVEAELAPAGFVRRGPVFRYFDTEGNGIALDLQRTTALYGKVEFFVNVGVLLAPHLRFFFGDEDPRLDAMPHDSVWQHRLVATDETATQSDHRFSLSTDADVERAAAVVRAWLAGNLPRLKGWLGNYDAMLAAMAEGSEWYASARATQLSSGERWNAARRPVGHWNGGIVLAYAHAERGDVDAVVAETATWYHDGPDSMAADLLALAKQRLTERQG